MDLLVEPQNGYKVFDVLRREGNHLYPFSSVIRRHGIYYVPDQWNYASIGPIMLFRSPMDTDLFLRIHQDGCLRAFFIKYIPIQPKTMYSLHLTTKHTISEIQNFWENSLTEPESDTLSIPPRGTCYAAAIYPTFQRWCPDADIDKVSAIAAKFGENTT